MAQDLDTRIREVELRLIDREETIRRQVVGGWRSARRTLNPRRYKAPAMAVAGALAVLGFWRAGRGRRGRTMGVPRGFAPRVGSWPGMASGAAGAGTAGSAGAPGGGWIRLLGLAWPLLPPHLRAKVSPAMASAAVSIGLPLAEWLIRRPPNPLLTVDAVDPLRFAGRWHVVASLAPRFARRTPLTGPLLWQPQADGGIEIVLESSSSLHGGAQAVEAHTARAIPGTAGAQLEWSDWPPLLQSLPWAWEPQAVVHVDPQYQEALVGNPARSRLWVMSREPVPPVDRIMALVQIAHDRGYATQRLVFDPALDGYDGHGV